MSSLFADAARSKAERRRELAALFAGWPAQPRDTATGRFVSSGFDGGARPLLPAPPPTHAEWLGEVLRSRVADRGANF